MKHFRKTRGLLYAVRCNFYRMAASPGFIISIVLTSAMCMLAKLPESVHNGEPSVIEGIFDMIRGKTFDGTDNSSFAIFSFYDNSFWFPVVLPFLAGIVSINLICDERSSGFLRLSLFRSSKRVYPLSIAIASALSSALAVLLGVLLFGCLCWLLFPEISQFSETSQFSADGYSAVASRFEMFGDVFTARGRASVILVKLLNLVLVVAGWGVFGTIVAFIIRNKFISLCLMISIGYMSAKAYQSTAIAPLFMSASSHTDPIFWLYLLFPYAQNNMYFIFKIRYEQPFILYVVFSLVVSALMCAVAALVFGRSRDVCE